MRLRRHWISAFLTIAVAPLANLATRLDPHWDNMQVKHTWNVVPANWESLGRPPPGTTIDLHIALKPERENALIEALYEVSDPKLPKYGAYLSKEQVAELVAPHPDTLGLVISWLERSGVSSPVSTTHGGGWLTVTGIPVSQADDLLGASYQVYRYTGTTKTILRTVGYSLPAELHKHVRTVVPTTYFSPPRTLQQPLHKVAPDGAFSSRDNAQPEPEVVPAFLRGLYNTVAYVPTAMDRNMLAVAGYADNSPSPADLTTFMRKYRTDVLATSFPFPVKQVNDGANNPGAPTPEANMNVQYVEGMAYPTPVVYYSIGGESEWEDNNQPSSKDADLVWLNYVLDLPEVPQTISISYGNTEPGFPLEYTEALCELFARLGGRGASVLLTTGDFGVGPGNCKEDDTSQVHPEVAAKHSGGGFSSHFPRPPYQKDVVPDFLQKLGNKYAGLFNPKGRGLPDISAQAYDFMIILGGVAIPQHGTSCSAPTVAGVISLLNDYRIAQGKPALGFLNPWLYSNGLAGLNDITSGSNPGCNTEGFPAVVGWDPVTGLGTPDFVKLQGNLPEAPISAPAY